MTRRELLAALVGVAVAPKMLVAVPNASVVTYDISSAYPVGPAVGKAALAAPSDHRHSFLAAPSNHRHSFVGGRAEFFLAE